MSAAHSPEHLDKAIDAFAQDWSMERLFLHPPVEHLLQCAAKLRAMATRQQAVVVAPYWPGSHWFLELMELSDDNIILPAGSLAAFVGDVAADAWPVIAFRIPSTTS